MASGLPHRRRLVLAHRAATTLAPLLVASFLAATLASELSGDFSLVAQVKRAILLTIPLLILSLIVAGGTGAALAKESKAPLVAAKRARSRLIAANGMLVLLPAAIILDRLATAGEPRTLFYGIQAVEVVAGSTNLLLMLRNARDGRRLAPKRRSTGMPTPHPAGQADPRGLPGVDPAAPDHAAREEPHA